MFSFITQTLAVPYGYTNEPLNMENYNLECFVTNNNRRNISSIRSDTVLPDIVMDTAPPPSPLRRARSYHFLFPEKHNTKTSWDVLTGKRQDEDLEPKEEETKEQKKIRTVGVELKKIADKFHLDHSKFLAKEGNCNEDVLEVVIPVVVTRCLQAGLVTLLCWRLLNKLR